ncbi:MAG: protein-export chaperone SecB [Spirochaetota bacterium]
MDKNKQPGIKCNSIILVESIFKRKPRIPKEQDIKLSFDVKNSISEDQQNLVTEVTAIINSEEEPVFAKVTYVGLFSVGEDKNLDLKDFSEINAPAILFPYIREEIHTRMLKAGLPKSLILPPINFVALVNDNNCE